MPGAFLPHAQPSAWGMAGLRCDVVQLGEDTRQSGHVPRNWTIAPCRTADHGPLIVIEVVSFEGKQVICAQISQMKCGWRWSLSKPASA